MKVSLKQFTFKRSFCPYEYLIKNLNTIPAKIITNTSNSDLKNYQKKNKNIMNIEIVKLTLPFG